MTATVGPDLWLDGYRAAIDTLAQLPGPMLPALIPRILGVESDPDDDPIYDAGFRRALRDALASSNITTTGIDMTIDLTKNNGWTEHTHVETTVDHITVRAVSATNTDGRIEPATVLIDSIDAVIELRSVAELDGLQAALTAARTAFPTP